MTFTVLVVFWAVMALMVLLLAGYRKVVAMHEDDLVHLHENQAPLIQQQNIVAHKLDVIDRWGKGLTAAAVIYGLMLAAWYLYQAWVESSKAPVP